MSEYTYEYELPPPYSSEQERAAAARRNVGRSLEMDPLRVSLGPTATELHRRVLAETAPTNGRTPS